MQTETQLKEKIIKYESYARMDENNPTLWYMLGDLYHQLGQFDDALTSYQNCLKHDPGNNTAHGRIGSLYISMHEFGKAETTLVELINKNESDPNLRFNFGLSLYYQKRWSEALEQFQFANSNGADTKECLPFICKCYHQLGQLQNAIDAAEAWVISTQKPGAKAYLALLQMDNQNRESAVDLAEQVLEVEPENSDAMLVSAMYKIENQDVDLAKDLLQRIVKSIPDHPRAIFAQGLISLYEKKYSQAVNYLQQAANLMPADPATRVALGWTKLVNQDFSGAEKVFREIIDIDRNFSEGHGGLAYALAMQNKIDLANESIKTAMWLDNKSFGAVAARAAILGIQGNQKRSVNLLAAMLEQPIAEGQPALIEHIKKYIEKQAKTSKSH